MDIYVCHSRSPEENPGSPADRVTEGCELLDKGVRFPARGQSPGNHYPSLQPQIFLVHVYHILLSLLKKMDFCMVLFLKLYTYSKKEIIREYTGMFSMTMYLMPKANINLSKLKLYIC